MTHDEIIDKIFEISETASSFAEKGKILQQTLNGISSEEILEHLDFAGVISERFGHDSTEEKLFAKYCDILMARALQELGFNAYAVDTRGDSVDVHATGAGYKLVGDAKAFRLSRTAKNAKDFKVESLNEWRRGADYALLLSPFYQYPNTRSQIYAQAIRYNVTILSYTHLAFIIRSQIVTPAELERLWTLSGTLQTGQNAQGYWASIVNVMLEITGKQQVDWETAVQREARELAVQARTQIAYWEDEKRRIRQLNHDEVTEMLINNLKINSKIDTIARAAGIDLDS